MLDGRGAISAVRQEELKHAKLILGSPVLWLGFPVVELANQSKGARPWGPLPVPDASLALMLSAVEAIEQVACQSGNGQGGRNGGWGSKREGVCARWGGKGRDCYCITIMMRVTLH